MTSLALKNTIAGMEEQNIDLLLVEEPTNLFYYTGLKLSKGQLLISKKKILLIVDGRYIRAAEQKSDFEVKLYSNQSLETYLNSFKNVTNVGFDAFDTSYARFLELQELGKKIKKKFISVQGLIKSHVRSIKSEDEIEKIKKASKMTVLGFKFLKTILKEGITEKQAVNQLLSFWLGKEVEPAFPPIVAFSENSASPHHEPSNRKLKKNECILIDLGAKFESYCSDMTRMLFLGKPKKEFIAIFDAVKIAQKKALSMAKPGILLSELDTHTREALGSYAPYFSHSLGHGVGLEIHEAPVFSNKELTLKPNMVITLEPGVYIPKLGGVRIEDTVLITEKGAETLTNCPKNLLYI